MLDLVKTIIDITASNDDDWKSLLEIYDKYIDSSFSKFWKSDIMLNGDAPHQTYHWLQEFCTIANISIRPTKKKDFDGKVEMIGIEPDTKAIRILISGTRWKKEIVTIIKYLKYLIKTKLNKDLVINLYEFKVTRPVIKLYGLRTTRSDLIGKVTFLFINQPYNYERKFELITDPQLENFCLDIFHLLEKDIDFHPMYLKYKIDPKYQLKSINDCLKRQHIIPVESLEEATKFIVPLLKERNTEVIARPWYEINQEILDAINCKEDNLESLFQEDKENTSSDNKLSW